MSMDEIEIFDITNPENPINTDTFSWSKCMKQAINDLYNDWDNDPVGTFACWASGNLCAFGAAAACTIKSFL
jgi:hypothetical protein